MDGKFTKTRICRNRIPLSEHLSTTSRAHIPEEEQHFIASTIDRLEAKTIKIFSQQKDKQNIAVARAEQKLLMTMQIFIQPKPEIMLLYPDWTAETTDLLADISYLSEFKKIYQKIKEEDLPKYKKRFKEWLNERMIFDIANFKTALENKESQILDSIKVINSSLLEIYFNKTPQIYIQLDINKTRDASVRDFKQMLKDAMPDPTKLIKGDEQELEYSFKKIKRIIEELSANELWRKKVTDGYTYLWDNGDETATATSLSAGMHMGAVTDANGCEVVVTANISEPTALTIAMSSTAESNMNADGTATTTVGEGTTGYTYEWDTNPVQTTATATVLSGGTYNVTATDANDCEVTGSVDVDQITGFEEFSEITVMNIFPNPSAGIVYLEMELERKIDVSIKLHNSLGQELLTRI